MKLFSFKAQAAGATARLSAQRLQAYGDAVQRLPRWVHPSWRTSIGLQTELHADGALLAAALGAGVPVATAFDEPAHRLAALPPALLCRVLRARGLLRHRSAVRHCLDSRMRARLVDWVHPAVFDAVLREAGEDALRDAPGMPLAPATGDPGLSDALAWEGFCLFQRDRAWTDPALQRLIRLGFAMSDSAPSELDDLPGASQGSAWVLQRLDRFVPEAPWLCG